MIKIKLSDEASVRQFVVIESNGCWRWLRSLTPDGYGRLGRGLAHRVVYELLVGKVTSGLELDHLCRNRACVNPQHLEPVTRRENILRGVSPTALNKRKQICKNGHPLDETNTYIRPNGDRGCRKCNTAAVAAYKGRQKQLRKAA